MPDAPNPPLSRSVWRVIRLMEMEQAAALERVVKPLGKSERSQQFNRSRDATRLKQMRDRLDALKREVAAVTGKEIRQAYRTGLRDAEQMAVDAGVRQSPIAGAFSVLDTRRAEVLSRRATSDLHKGIDGMYRATERTVRRARGLGLNDAKLNRLLAGGFVAGVPARAQKEIRDYVDRAAGKTGGLIEVPTRSGGVRQYAPRHYGRMVYETKLREATTIATAQRLQEQGIDLVKIIGSNSDNFCTHYVGKAYSLSGTHPVYPPLSSIQGPPFHPFCSKTIVAFIERLAKPADLEAAKPDELTEAMKGKSANEAQRIFAEARKVAGSSPAPPPPPSPAPTPATPTPPPSVATVARDTRRKLDEVGRGFEATADRLGREIDDLEREIEVMSDTAGTPTAEAFADVMDRRRELLKQRQALTADRREAALALIRVEKPASVTVTFSGNLDATRRANVQAGAAELAKLVDASVLPTIPIEGTTPKPGTKRSYYYGGRIHMAKRTGDVSTVIHELGHLIEDLSPDLHRAALAFLDRRTQGEPLQSLRRLTRRNFRADERARPDDFWDPYVGKDYGGRYTEIISMSLEYFWRDPIGFARRDPDFFEFLFRAMRGDF